MAPPNDDDLSTFMALRINPTPPTDARFRMTVEAGPDTGTAFEMGDDAPGRMLVGTSSVCALRLTDRNVSRRHLALAIDGERLRLTDTGSKNGTRVGTLAVQEAWLDGGETVHIGASVLRVSKHASSGDAQAPGTEHQFGRMLGVSREMRRLFPLLGRLAASDLPVLIEGETGSGKETAARTLHENGPRHEAPFVVLDCSGLDEAMLEAELPASYESARGGTLFIDEIAELPSPTQARLLHLLEHRPAQGKPGETVSDVRVISSTRHDLDGAVADNRFRDDLYHRIAVARVELPPLRLRRGDLPFLTAHFCQELGGEASRIPPSVIDNWATFRWPGNLRELRNAVAQRLVLGELSELQPARTGAGASTSGDDFIARILQEKRVLTDARALVVAEFERRYVETMLQASGGNVVRAAAMSGVARRYFQILKSRLGL